MDVRSNKNKTKSGGFLVLLVGISGDLHTDRLGQDDRGQRPL